MHTEDQESETRDIELENILGNLLIAEYQVDKLRARLAEKVAGVIENPKATGNLSIPSRTTTNSSASELKSTR